MRNGGAAMPPTASQDDREASHPRQAAALSQAGASLLPMSDIPIDIELVAARLAIGDARLRGRELNEAAQQYIVAHQMAGQLEDDTDARTWMSAAKLRLGLLLAQCIVPEVRPSRFGCMTERWVAVLTVAESGLLAPHFASVVLHLLALVRPLDGLTRDEVADSYRAWEVLMACRPLVVEAFHAIDEYLVRHDLHRLRAELAQHPSADGERWLGMLGRCRTPDLVHTLLETPRATADVRVRAALG